MENRIFTGCCQNKKVSPFSRILGIVAAGNLYFIFLFFSFTLTLSSYVDAEKSRIKVKSLVQISASDAIGSTIANIENIPSVFIIDKNTVKQYFIKENRTITGETYDLSLLQFSKIKQRRPVAGIITTPAKKPKKWLWSNLLLEGGSVELNSQTKFLPLEAFQPVAVKENGLVNTQIILSEFIPGTDLLNGDVIFSSVDGEIKTAQVKIEPFYQIISLSYDSPDKIPTETKEFQWIVLHNYGEIKIYNNAFQSIKKLELKTGAITILQDGDKKILVMTSDQPLLKGMKDYLRFYSIEGTSSINISSAGKLEFSAPVHQLGSCQIDRDWYLLVFAGESGEEFVEIFKVEF
jgi:hypothetical protein